jgi:hypothetical protein
MNYASLMFVVTVFAGAACGSITAAAQKTGIVGIILSAVGGLLLGFGLGSQSYKLALSALSSKRRSGVLSCFVYVIIPLLSLLVVICVTAWIVRFVIPFGSQTSTSAGK